MSDVLQRLMSGSYPDPKTGTPVPMPIKSIVVEKSLAGGEAELVAALQLGSTLAVVSDPETDAAMGSRVEKALSSAFRLVRIRLPRHSEAAEDTVRMVEQAGAEADAYIAVGSGTINDLCKYAGARTGKRYAVFATAPSMNGYTSQTASIRVAGMKRTLPAQLAAGVFMDLSVMAASPVRLIRAGVGDSVCRPACQADWLLAHHLRGDQFLELPFLLLAEDEERLFAEPEALLRGDLEAHACLARVLTLTGLNTAYCGGSHPGSQGEHLISHYMELLEEQRGGRPGGHQTFHGEQIGVTTLTMARLQQELLAKERIEVHPCDLEEADFTRRYGPELAPACWKEFLPKRLDRKTADAMNERLRSGWESTRRLVADVAWPPEKISAVLNAIGAPTRPEELGWDMSAYRDAIAHAAETRNRYTFLDLARDARLLRADFR
ncbi:MAG: iron-containing alcohol dehydrogenase [Spirochaetia bacterium]|jgi:glycerol-1-phosphate dehydrogenase [NAD(P)+]